MAKLSMDSSEYDSGMRRAENKTSGLKDTITKLGIGAAVGGIGKAALNVGMDFEEGMSGVAATMGMTSESIRSGNQDFINLSNAAKEMGRTTKFSSTQAAEALNFLALAGYDADKAIETLPTILTAASAGGLDLAYASDLVTDSMSSLGIEVKDVDKFVDQLAKTSQKSNTSFGQLGEAILTVGGTAKILKGGTVELNTALGILADNGIKGAEGGTLLRNVILSLTSPTDKAAKLMKKLGIDVFDAKGEMLPLQDILMDMDQTLGKMTAQEKQQALSNIFNKNDLKGVNALLANSNERWSDLAKNIEESRGAGENMAKTMNDTLKGRLTELNSALEGAGIAVYEKFQEPLKNTVNWITENIGKVVTAFNEGKLDNTLNLIGSALAGVITYIGLMKGYKIAKGIFDVASGLFNAIKMVKSFSGAMALLNTVMAANPVGLVIMGIAALTAAFVYCWNRFEGFRNFWIEGWKGIKDITSNIGGWLKTFFTEDIPNAIKNTLDWFKSIPTRISEAWSNAVASTKQWFEDMKLAIKNKLLEIKQDIYDFFMAIPTKLREIGLQIGTNIGEFIKNIQNFFTVELPKIYDNIVLWFSKLPQEIAKWFTETWNNTVKWAKDTWDTINKACSGFLNNIINWFKQIPTKVKNWFDETIKKVIKFKDDMVKKAKETGSEFSKWLEESVKNLPKKMMDVGKNIVKGVWEGIKGMGRWFTDSVKNFFGGIVDGVKSTLGIHSPSRVFRDQVGKWIPAGVSVGIEKGMPELEDKMKSSFSNLSNVDIPIPDVSLQGRNSDIQSLISALKTQKIEIVQNIDGREFTREVVAPYQNELEEYAQDRNVKYSYS